MSRVILLCLALLVFLQSFGQYRLEGVVNDAEGNPLSGAHIILKKSFQGSSTGSDGKFIFPSLRGGEHTLQISFLGFTTVTRTIVLEKNEFLTVILERSAILADEVIVSALRVSENDPMAHSNLYAEEIARINTGGDIPFLLDHTPSLVAISETGTGIGYTALRIRGSDPTRINVTINGIPLNDSESQVVYWVDIPDFSSSVETVQIQRGVGSSTHGAAAFGGSINFQTKASESEPYLRLSSYAGSFNTFRNSVSAGTGLLHERFTLDTRISKVVSDGYIRHSGSDHRSFFLSGAWHSPKSLLRATLISGEEQTGISWWGVPGDMLDTDRRYNPAGVYTDSEGNTKYYTDQKDNYIQTHYQLHYSREFFPGLNVNTALHYTKGAGYYEQYMDDENDYHSTAFYEYGLDSMFVLGADTITRSDMVRQKWLDNDFYGFVFSVDYRLGNHSATLGGGWNSYGGDHFGKILWVEKNNLIPKDHQWYFNEGIKTDWNTFLKMSFSIGPDIHFFTDIQYRSIFYKLKGPDDDLKDLTQEHRFHFFNPKVGVFYTINASNKSYISLSVGNKEPTRSDFKDAAGDITATPKPERMYDLEAGYFHGSNRISFGVNFYYMYYKDQLVPTGEKSNTGYDIMTNVDKSYRAGAEFSFALLLTDRIQWDLNVTASDNRILDYVEYASYYDEFWNKEYRSRSLGKTALAYSPSLTGSGNLHFRISESFRISFLTKYVGAQYFDHTMNKARKLDPYSVSNLRFDYFFKPKHADQIGLQLQVNNLFNSQYISNAYGGNWYEQGIEKTWAYYFPQAGINFMAGLNIRF